MICSKCSNSLSESAKFCPQCGNKVKLLDSPKQSKISEFLAKPRNAYGLILVTLTLALGIVFLILNSNQRAGSKNNQIPTIPLEITTEINVLRQKISEDPDDIQSNIRIGNLLFDAGDYAGALPYYGHATHLDSLNIAVRIDLAVCYFNIQNYTDAIENMKKALKLEPTHKKGLFNIGIMYSNIGKADSSRMYWERLVTVFPESNEAKKAQEMLQKM